jgi:hypothetical protein
MRTGEGHLRALIGCLVVFYVAAAQAQDVSGPSRCGWLTQRIVPPQHTRPLLDKLLAAHLQKSEYESVAEFEGRKEKSFSKLLPKDKHVWEGALLGSTGHYNAETRTLEFSESDLTYMLQGTPPFLSMVVDTKPLIDGVQRRQNAFGASVNVSVKEADVFGLGFKQSPAVGSTASTGLSLAIPMEPGRAQNRWALQFRFGGDVTGEVHTADGYSDATLDSPQQVTEHFKVLVVENACGVIYDPFHDKPLATFSWPTIVMSTRPF